MLRADGTLWLNLGDAYSGKANGGPSFNRHRGHDHAASVVAKQVNTTGFAPYKSLLGLPWRIALAMIDAAWILRIDNIWHKTNAMPESVNDRLSGRHEYLFLFTRSSALPLRPRRAGGQPNRSRTDEGIRAADAGTVRRARRGGRAIRRGRE